MASPANADSGGINHVFLTTDLTARADRPTDRAIDLAAACQARLTVCHILEKGRHDDDAQEEARTEIARYLEARNARAEIVVERGNVVEQLVDQAIRVDADLLVTGVARIGRLGDLIMGTQLERIVHHSSLPVLIAKNRPLLPYARLVVASDFSASSKAALLAAMRLFPELPVHLVNAFHVPFEGFLHSDSITEEFRTEQHLLMTKFIEDLALGASDRERLSYHIGYGDTMSVVYKAIENQESDLAVVGTHGTSGFRANMMGSMARALITYLPCDILAVRE